MFERFVCLVCMAGWFAVLALGRCTTRTQHKARWIVAHAATAPNAMNSSQTVRKQAGHFPKQEGVVARARNGTKPNQKNPKAMSGLVDYGSDDGSSSSSEEEERQEQLQQKRQSTQSKPRRVVDAKKLKLLLLNLKCTGLDRQAP